jgi:hypothetical protein
MLMEKIEIQDSDFLQVARAQASQDVAFALQVKCMALIRMLEEAETRYTELEARYQTLLPVEGGQVNGAKRSSQL